MAEEDKAFGIVTLYGAVTGTPSYRVRGPDSHVSYSTPQLALSQYNKLKKFAAEGGFKNKDRRK